MTIIKNHFEVFLVTSKKQGNGIIESKVGLYSIKASSHILVTSVLISFYTLFFGFSFATFLHTFIFI
jgi:hypothetical protein